MSEVEAIVASDLSFSHKPLEEFRNYADSDRQDTVRNHYRMMRQNQTVDFVKRMHDKYSFEKPRALMTMAETFEELKSYVDSSDPDISLPNLVHMLQTAEGIRAAGHPDWFQLVGLIHDMGKVMFLWGAAEDGQQGTAEGPQVKKILCLSKFQNLYNLSPFSSTLSVVGSWWRYMGCWVQNTVVRCVF